MGQIPAQQVRKVFGILQIAILVLVVITALIHLQRGIAMSAGGFGGGPPGGAAGGPPGGFRPPAGASGGFNILQILPLPLSTLFLLNGIGYFVLGIALSLPPLYRFQRTIRWLLIAFTAITILLYFMVVGFRLNMIGLLDKAIELALIVLLLIEDRGRSPAGT